MMCCMTLNPWFDVSSSTSWMCIINRPFSSNEVANSHNVDIGIIGMCRDVVIRHIVFIVHVKKPGIICDGVCFYKKNLQITRVVVQTPPPHKAFTNFVLVFDRWVGCGGRILILCSDRLTVSLSFEG